MEGQTCNIGPKIAAALVALQAEVDPIKPNALNGFLKTKYVDLLGVIREVKPKLEKHKLAVVQMPCHINGQSALRTTVIHESGEYIESTMPILLPSTRTEERYDKDLKKPVTRVVEADAQDQGAGITYLRRYAYMASLGLVTDDGDVHVSGNDSRAALGLRNPPKGSSTKPPTEAQIGLIKRLASDKGFDEAHINARLAEITSSAEASEAITALKALERDEVSA